MADEGCTVKTLILLITLIMVFVLGYMLGASHARTPARSHPISRLNSDDSGTPN